MTKLTMPGINTNALKGKMATLGLKQLEVAKASGIAPATFNRFVNNKSVATVKDAQAIAEALNLTDDEYLVIFRNRKEENA